MGATGITNNNALSLYNMIIEPSSHVDTESNIELNCLIILEKVKRLKGQSLTKDNIIKLLIF